MAVAQLPDLPQVAGRLEAHPAGSLDERLHDHRRYLLRMKVEHALELCGVARFHAMSLRKEGGVGGVEEVDATDGDGPEGVTVIGVSKRDE